MARNWENLPSLQSACRLVNIDNTFTIDLDSSRACNQCLAWWILTIPLEQACVPAEPATSIKPCGMWHCRHCYL